MPVLHRPVEVTAKSGHSRCLNCKRNLAHRDAGGGAVHSFIKSTLSFGCDGHFLQPTIKPARIGSFRRGVVYVWQDRASLGAGSALRDRERDRRDDEISRLKGKDLEGQGFMTELIIEAFARVGHDVTVKFLTWKRALESVKSDTHGGLFTV